MTIGIPVLDLGHIWFSMDLNFPVNQKFLKFH